MIATFNVTDTTNPTYILFNYSSGASTVLSNISEIEIDGVVQQSVTNTYTFDTTGEHVVKYTLTDPTTMPSYSKYQYGMTTYYGMFNDCGRLTSVTIPPTVTTFNGAFRGCWSLTSANIPKSVTTIGIGTFYGCSVLTSITIPSSVTTISSYAFQGCYALTSITIPSSVTTIAEGAFTACRGLTSVTIPNSITRIEDYTFNQCSALTSITIPNGVYRIGQDAFNHCTSLRNITFPSSVTSIGSGCIYNTGGTNVTVEAITPPGLGYPNAMNSATNIYVPAESVDAYKAATNWSNYASKIQAIPSA